MKQTLILIISGTLVAFPGTILCAKTSPARNQEQQKEAIYKLPNYVVVAHTYEVPQAEVGSTVHVINREDLEIGQSTFILDALRELPGVYVRNNGGPGSSFGMTTRGLTAAPIILLDGIDVSNPSDGQALNPGFLFSNSVETVELLKGSRSSLYGANALAGVINITTREAKKNESSASLSLGGNLSGTRETLFSYQIQQGPLSFSTGLSHYASDGFSAQDGNTEDDGYENTGTRAKVTYEATEDLHFYVTGYYIEAKTDIDSGSTDPFGFAESKQYFSRTGAIFQATEPWQTELHFAYTKVDSETIGTGFQSPSVGERYAIDWRNVFTLNEDWRLAAGSEREFEDNRSAAGDRDNRSWYADSNLELFEHLHWTLGGRYDENSDYGISRTWHTTLNYRIEPIHTRLHTSYGTSFQAPNFYETSNSLFGNPQLSPEEGESWDLGIEISLFDEKLVLDVTGFHNEIDDQIIFVATQFIPTFEGTFINLDSYKSEGIEFSTKWQATKNIQLQANYTYTDAKSSGSRTPLHVPENTVNLSAIWKTLEDALRLKTSVRYIDDRATFSAIADDFLVVDLAGQYTISDTIMGWVSVSNLLDEKYQEIAGFNSPDFNIRAGIQIHF